MRALCALLLACAVGCVGESDDGDATPTMDGVWDGGVGATSGHTSITFHFVATDDGGAIAGNGTTDIGSSTSAITLTGSRSGTHVSLTIVFDDGEEGAFSGTVAEGVAYGTFTGLLSSNESMTLHAEP